MEKTRVKNIIKFLLLVIIFIMVYFVIKSTYSKYLTMQNSQTNTNVSKWHILVNEQNIVENSNFSETLRLNFDSNPNIANNVIAPTINGTVDVELESTGTEVPFKYEFKVAEDLLSSSILPDFKIYAYKLNDSAITYLESDETILSGIITPPTDITQSVINNFTLYLTWYDEADNILNNVEDVNVSKLEDASGIINLELKVTQIED